MTIMAWEYCRRIEERLGRNLTRKSFEAIAAKYDSARSYKIEPPMLLMKDLIETVPPKQVREFMERNGHIVLTDEPNPKYHPLFNDFHKPKPLTQSEGQISAERWGI